MNYLKSLMFLCIATSSLPSNATDQYIENLDIARIRSVGNYQQGEVYDNTIELWFSSPLTLNSNMNCSVDYRVMVDANHTHVVSAAYMALASGKKVNINLDDTLSIRGGACEISFLDISK